MRLRYTSLDDFVGTNFWVKAEGWSLDYGDSNFYVKLLNVISAGYTSEYLCHRVPADLIENFNLEDFIDNHYYTYDYDYDNIYDWNVNYTTTGTFDLITPIECLSDEEIQDILLDRVAQVRAWENQGL